MNRRFPLWSLAALPLVVILALSGCMTPTAEAENLDQVTSADEAVLEVDEIEPEAYLGSEPEPEPESESDPEPEADPEKAVEPELLLTDVSSPEIPSDAQRATVTRVVDGDTIEVQVNGVQERVRFVGIDTPERGDAGSQEATEFTRAAIDSSNGIVYLEQSGNDRDRFDRLRRVVWLADGTNLNDALLAAGHAVVFGASGPASADGAEDSSVDLPATGSEDNAPILGTGTNGQFRNCTEVWNLLGRPITSDDPGFHSRLDRDNDGVGCERDPR